MAARSPILLLADSAPLFRMDVDGRPWIAGYGESFQRAAYLGASNGDQPEFYEIFEAVMDRMKVEERRHVKGSANDDDIEYLKTADLILLAGGDVETGLDMFEAGNLAQAIKDAYERRVLLIGVSAGAVQMGVIANPEGTPGLVKVNGANANGSLATIEGTDIPMGGSHAPSPSEDPAHDSRGFRFAPFQIDVHRETFSELKKNVERRGLGARGIGIPSGGAAALHRSGTLEPFGTALTEYVRSSTGVIENILLPHDDQKKWSTRPPPKS